LSWGEVFTVPVIFLKLLFLSLISLFARIKNYLTTAYRSLLRHKGASLIKVAGLSIGMCCCVLILVYLTDELSGGFISGVVYYALAACGIAERKAHRRLAGRSTAPYGQG
jgi:hypothetical protein